MKQFGELYSKQEIASAADFLKTIVPLEPLRDTENLFEGTEKIFDQSFKASLMRRGAYYRCKFVNVDFDGSNGNNSIFKSSIFTNCSFTNANFIYSDFTNSNLTINTSSSRYDFSDFTDTTIFNSKINGTSFRDCCFRNIKLENCKIKQCDFSDSIFSHCYFKDIDLSIATLDFSEITDSTFQNVTLPFFGVLNLTNGFEQIIEQNDVWFKPASSDYIAKSKKYIEDIRLLKPVFYYEKIF